MKQAIIIIGFALMTGLFGSCNASGDDTSAKDGAAVPSALDTIKPPIHPGMVDSTGAPRLR